MQLVDDGLIGTVTEINAAFTFTIGPDGADNYRWKADHGGGALLDVGIYCLGPPVRLWLAPLAAQLGPVVLEERSEDLHPRLNDQLPQRTLDAHEELWEQSPRREGPPGPESRRGRRGLGGRSGFAGEPLRAILLHGGDLLSGEAQ